MTSPWLSLRSRHTAAHGLKTRKVAFIGGQAAGFEPASSRGTAWTGHHGLPSRRVSSSGPIRPNQRPGATRSTSRACSHHTRLPKLCFPTLGSAEGFRSADQSSHGLLGYEQRSSFPSRGDPHRFVDKAPVTTSGRLPTERDHGETIHAPTG